MGSLFGAATGGAGQAGHCRLEWGVSVVIFAVWAPVDGPLSYIVEPREQVRCVHVPATYSCMSSGGEEVDHGWLKPAHFWSGKRQKHQNETHECSTAADLIRAVHVTCHETGHHWFGGLVQTLNDTERDFIIESTTAYGETACVAAALPALENRSIYQQMFAPPFGVTRGIHVGALFHALQEFTLPEYAGLGVTNSIYGRYAKGAAFLHMLENYLNSAVFPVRFLTSSCLLRPDSSDASVTAPTNKGNVCNGYTRFTHVLPLQGAMHMTLASFFNTFRHRAATANDLLCHLAATLSHTRVATLGRHLPECYNINPPPNDANGPVTPPVTAEPIAVAREWLGRLRGWITQPGVPLLELTVSAMDGMVTGSDVNTAMRGGFQRLQVERVPSPFLVRPLHKYATCMQSHAIHWFSCR
jgi:hypothetical protein